LGIEEYFDASQIGHGTFRALHFSPGVTTNNDLSWSASLGFFTARISIHCDYGLEPVERRVLEG
jgi:hypothetical protein